MNMQGKTTGEGGRYLVQEKLGEGAMGVVHLTLDQKLQKQVVLKMLKPEHVSSPKVRERFRNEALIQANLEHPNIVRALDIVEDGEFFGIVVEYVQGPSLEDHIAGEVRGPSELSRVIEVMGPVIEAVGFAHEHGVVHRDLKPANILIDRRRSPEWPRVTDFGIAKILSEAGARLTREGSVLGTPHYMPPEQLKGVLDLDGRADVYALGVILYQLASGQVPYGESTEYEVIHRVLSGERLPALAGAIDGIPEAFDELVQQATMPDRDARLPTADALLAGLRALANPATASSASKVSGGADMESSSTPAPGVQASQRAATIAPSGTPATSPPSSRSDAETAGKPTAAVTSGRRRPSWLVLVLVGVVVVAGASYVAWSSLSRASRTAVERIDPEAERLAKRATSGQSAKDLAEKDALELVAKARAEKEANDAAARAAKDNGRANANRRQPGGIDWVSLPAGSFVMGSRKGESDERPQHRVSLSSYALARSETTVGQYRTCVDAGSCSSPGTKGACNWGRTDRTDRPVNCVKWSQAKDFCAWVGGRLPTEAEWEYAARSGGRDQTYPWGNETPSCRRVIMHGGGEGCGRNRTRSVCSRSAGNTAQGLCDMLGNVWEWVADWYGESYYGDSPRDNPKGPTYGTHRGFRGGSWNLDKALFFRAANRGWYAPDSRSTRGGFRCAASSNH